MKRSRLLVTLGALTALTGPLILLSAPGGADAASNGTHRHGHVIGFDGGPARGGDDGASLADRAAQYSAERTAPGTTVSAAALLAARGQANALAARGGHWVEQTTSSYNNEPAGFTDPFWSNAGAGFGISGGRVTDLAVDGKVMYAATAGGGVWASANKGKKWTPLSDNQPSLSTGALTVNRTDDTVWIGTGEANTNADSYLGVGVYRLQTDGQGGPKGAQPLLAGPRCWTTRCTGCSSTGGSCSRPPARACTGPRPVPPVPGPGSWHPPPLRRHTSTTSPTSPSGRAPAASPW